MHQTAHSCSPQPGCHVCSTIHMQDISGRAGLCHAVPSHACRGLSYSSAVPAGRIAQGNRAAFTHSKQTPDLLRSCATQAEDMSETLSPEDIEIELWTSIGPLRRKVHS